MKTFLSIVSLSFIISLNYISCGNSSEKHTGKTIQSAIKQVVSPDNSPVKQVIHFNFETDSTGTLPADWSQSFNGRGGTDWIIIDDQGNKVMAQLYSDNPNGHFNVVVNKDIQAKNMELKVRIKGVKGRHDQGGGFVWRFQDKDNYYVVRANPLEDNVVLYKVKNGKRTDLPLLGKGRTYGVNVPKLGNGWNTMKLMVKESVFTVFLNGNELFKVQDDTFTKAGKVGFWTKADAVTYFDDFNVKIDE